MSLDFAPNSAPAPASQRVTAHAKTEARLILSNPEQHILALVIPIGLILAGRLFEKRMGIDFSEAVPSVLALAMWSTSFTSLAIATGFERRYHVLERLAATPLGKTGVLLGKAAAIGMIVLLQIAVLSTVGLLAGWRPHLVAGHALVAVVAVLLSIAAFAGLGLCLSGTAKPEITLAVANLVYLVGAMLGIMIPLASYPGVVQPLVAVLPTTALGEAMRYGTTWSLGVLAIWAVASLLIARKVFSWTS